MNVVPWLGCSLAAAMAAAQAGPQLASRFTLPWSTAAFAGWTQALDMEGDGDLDVFAIGAISAWTVCLWRNDGGGGFTNVTATHLPPVPQSYTALVFDAEGDGDDDVFVGGYWGPSILLRNQGNGTFTAAPFAVNFPGFAAAADFDGDGDRDLAITETGFSTPQQRIWRNDGTGGFTPVVLLGPSTQGSTLHPFDHDADGDLDLLCGKNPIRLWRNDGGFVFTDIGTSAIVQPTGTVFGVHAMGDLDGDGDLDVVASRNGSPDVVLRQQGGVFAPAGVLPHALSEWLVLDDVDGDGDLDVVHGRSLRLSLNDGTGTFTDGVARIHAGTLHYPAVADFDGDGDTDLLGSESLFAMAMVVNRALDLDVPPPQVGQPWPVALGSQPGYALADHPCVLAVGLVRRPQPLAIPGLGDLWLDLAAAALFPAVVPAATGVVGFPFALPAAPMLVGLELHVQGLVAQMPAGPRLTTLRSVVIQ